MRENSKESSSPTAETPMLRQWSELKSQAGEALLFFRLGDFYELFGDDARKAAPVMGVVLTSRNSKDPNALPLCGVPLHQFENYVSKLLDAGFKVALAEQTEEPKPGKALVRREIVQWFSPGMRLLQTDERPHYLATLLVQNQNWSLAAADVATGDLRIFSGNQIEEVQEIIERLSIEDLRGLQNLPFAFQVKMAETTPTIPLSEAESWILKSLNLVSMADSPAQSKMERQTLGALLKIIGESHPRETLSFRATSKDSDSVLLTSATRRNLNLFEPPGHSVFDFINYCVTAFGRRELKRLLGEPTQNLKVLQGRQNLIHFFKTNPFIRKKLRERLSGVLDFHRLLRRRLEAKQLFRIYESLQSSLEAAQLLAGDMPEILKIQKASAELREICDRLKATLQWSDLEDSGWIQSGILKDLDDLRELQKNAGQVLADLEEGMRLQTKISTLKVKFHQVFGYVFEATSTHKDKIPSDAKRIQTLANSERFKTDELQVIEEKLLSLESRIREAENAELKRLARAVEEKLSTIYELVDALSEIDAAQSLAEVSSLNGWTSPLTSESQIKFEMVDGVHPLTSPFVPISFSLETKSQSLILLTGPNMAGKSTLMRMAALCALLHQIGSDIPAQKFESSLFDRIMCRMGAQDDITSGQSTFFVEMKEVSQMIHGASERSFLLFDEIGRGTSTFDGMALAWAITEAVHDLRPLGIIATHYLEMAELENECHRLKAYHLGVEEHQGKLLFTRRLERGPASRSYGIQVARLAQIPEGVLKRAQQKLALLEEPKKPKTKQLQLFALPKSPSAET